MVIVCRGCGVARGVDCRPDCPVGQDWPFDEVARVNSLVLRVEALEGQVAHLENALRLHPKRDWQMTRPAKEKHGRLDSKARQPQNMGQA